MSYYTKTGIPYQQTKGLSAQMRTEFGLIETAFTQVQTDFTLKASLASPTFTGVPTAPTAAAGTGTTQVATCAFVVAQALSGVLPGQTGNAGRFIGSDGTNASWGPVLGAWVNLTASATLTNNRAHRFATTGQNFTTPATAGLMDGDLLLVQNTGTDLTNAITANSGQTIVGAASRTLDVTSVMLKWCAALTDWRWVA